MPRPGPRRLPRALLLGLAACTVLAGCAADPDTPSPALVSITQDALSAARTAELGLQVAANGRSFATTTSVLLDDMAEELADATRELELQTTGTKVDAAFRSAALEATRDASTAVHTAQQGDPQSAVAALDAAADTLERLGQEG